MSRVVTISLASSPINPFASLPIVSLTRLLIPLITVCLVAGIGSGELQAQQAELKGKIDGIAIRVPTPDVSLTELTDDQATYLGVDKSGPYKSDHYRY